LAATKEASVTGDQSSTLGDPFNKSVSSWRMRYSSRTNTPVKDDDTPSPSQHRRKTYNHGVWQKDPAWKEGVPVWLGDGVEAQRWAK
jgi:hypothetical protein